MSQPASTPQSAGDPPSASSVRSSASRTDLPFDWEPRGLARIYDEIELSSQAFEALQVWTGSRDIVDSAAGLIACLGYRYSAELLVPVAVSRSRKLPAQWIQVAVRPEDPFADVVDGAKASRDSPTDRDRSRAPNLGVIEGDWAGDCDLILRLDLKRADPKLLVVYDGAVFERQTALRIAGHCENLITSMCRGPETPVGNLGMLGQAELDRLRVRPVDDPPDLERMTLHDRFRDVVRLQGDAEAIRYSGAGATYLELSAESARLCNALIERGIEVGDRVAILLETGPRLISSMLATLGSGAVMVCLDPAYPSDRLQAILDEAEPVAIIGDASSLESHGDLFERADASRFLYSDDADHRVGWETFDEVLLADQSDDWPGLAIDVSAPCYVAYTSGSSGRPKGILQSHRAFDQFIGWQARELDIGKGDRWAQWASVAYDASYCEIFGTLCFGATLLLADARTRYDPRALVNWATRERATILQVVPSFSREVRDLVDVDETAAHDSLSSLRLLMLAGERLSVDLARRWLASPNALAIYNLYGPSESVLATFHKVSTEDLVRKSIPIGRPIDGRQILILDDTGNLVPLGTKGEIYIQSRYLAIGYWRNEAETKRRFIQNPLGDDVADTVYRTGDVGRWTSDGVLEFSGRNDGLVKLRGVRVELGDIEAAVQMFPAVRAAVAVVRTVAPAGLALIAKEWEARPTETDGKQVLAAYVVSDTSLDVGALRSFVETQLPSHMVPQYFLQIDELPRNANRKVDVAALPPIDPRNAERISPYLAPRTEAESVVAGVWQDVLAVDRVGATDGFFELGGDSLLAMRVLDRLRDATGAGLAFRDLFANQTVAELALVISGTTAEIDVVTEPVADPLHRSLPLTLAQQGIWFLWRLDPDSPYYTAQGSIRFEGTIDVPALIEAWETLIMRHEVLRSQYVLQDGSPTQFFLTDAPPDLPFVDLSQLPAEERRPEMIRRSSQQVKAFDLASDPLLKGELYQFDEDEHELAITFHEIILDLWGLSLLMSDLRDLYRAVVEGKSTDSVSEPASFASYVAWENQAFTRQTLETQGEYWAKALAGELPVLALPTDHARPAVPDYQGESESLILTEELTSALKELSRRHGSTLFMTLLSAFSILLGSYSGQRDLIIGAPIANRSRAKSSEIVGFFLNMLPLRVQVEPALAFSKFLENVRDTVVGGLSNADYPFMWMLESADIPRDQSVTPAFQVMFNMLNLPQQALSDDDLTITFSELDSGYTKYDLALYAQEHGDRIFLQMAYLTSLFEPATVRRLLTNLEILLTDAVETPARPIAELRIMSDRDRDYLLEQINDTSVDFGTIETITTMFERQVVERPDAIAYRFGDSARTYARLNRSANRLARHLQAQGVVGGSRVAFCTSRGFDMVTAILAIVKAGGSYVALDADYPMKRLEQIILDSKASTLIVSASNDQFGAFDGTTVVLGGFDELGYDDSDLSVPSSPDDTLAVVYTSSTTGRAKGVTITHRAVINRLEWMWADYPFQVGDVAVVQKSAALVAATWELFGALLYGVTTVLLPVEDVRDPGRLWDVCERNNVSHFLGVPALLEGLLAEAERRPGQWTSLRFATTSAEPIPLAMVERWHQLFPQVVLLNLYGSTECSSNALGYDTTSIGGRSARVPIGTPLPNTRAYVLDDQQRLLPWGAVGELCISGDCLALGYEGNEALTNERFVESPFVAGARLYRTGDLARVRADGNFELLGRSDLQVNVRGFRVELNDIEATLSGHPSVARCAALLDDQTPALPRLAVIVEGSEASEAELRAFLMDRLPSYMVPTHVAIVDHIPLTPNGKIDRSRLEIPIHLAELGRRRAGPRDDLERRLLAIWKDVLGVESVGIRDDFFELGGHSLLAVRMMDRIDRTLGTDLPIAILFRAPSIEALAKEMRDSSTYGLPSRRWETLVPIQTNGDRPPFFCVHGGGGEVFHFNSLANRLGHDQPFYGLQPHAWSDSRATTPSVRDLAGHYVNAIRTMQPEGPYFLGGYCFGAIIALEIAQRLGSVGQEVALLALIEPSRVNVPIDAHVIGPPASGQNRVRTFAGRLLKALKDRDRTRLLPRDESGTLRTPRSMAIDAYTFVSRGLKRGLIQTAHRLGRSVPRRLRTFNAMDRSRLAGNRYRAEPYRGSIDLFLARRHGHSWLDIASAGTSIHTIPPDERGYLPDHLEMLQDPWIEHVARPLRQAIDDSISAKG